MASDSHGCPGEVRNMEMEAWALAASAALFIGGVLKVMILMTIRERRDRHENRHVSSR